MSSTIDILDIRTKGGINGQVPLIQAP